MCVYIYLFPNLPIGILQKTDYILWLVNIRADISGELQTAVILWMCTNYLENKYSSAYTAVFTTVDQNAFCMMLTPRSMEYNNAQMKKMWFKSEVSINTSCENLYY